jgi:hypothetical protein
MLSMAVHNEIRSEIQRLRDEAAALEALLQTAGVVGQPIKRGPGRPRKDAGVVVPAFGRKKPNWSPAAKAASKARIKAMWKATKDAGFKNLGEWKKSKAGKAWAAKHA